MKFSKDKYKHLMEGFVDLMDTINMDVPPEIKPFYELYKQLKDNPEVDASLFEDESILKGLTVNDNNCTFGVGTDVLDGLTIELLLFVPALKIRDFNNKMLFSEYRVRMSYTHDPTDAVSNETHMILSALSLESPVTDLLKYICKKNQIIVKDNTLEWFQGFIKSTDGNLISYTKRLQSGTKKKDALVAHKETRKLFEKLVLELRVGLGVL